MELQQYLPNFQQTQTPFYFYDTELLQRTFQEASQEIQGIENGHIHLALKANNHPIMLQMARTYGMGIDAVSGGEVELAVSAGIPNKKIVFAGVGKTDEEIRYALKHNILCFNVESVPEIEVIQELAQELKCTTNIAIRVNPNVDAHTHQNITTGLEENKFGIALQDLLPTIKRILELPNLNYYGLHFHIGSQILEKEPFIKLCQKINRLQTQLEKQGIETKSINVGGGLGVDYIDPLQNEMADFKSYFEIFKKKLRLRPNQEFHCELGRSLTAQCGALITKVIYVKQTKTKQFAILDAGFTDLIRPSLYQATHKAISLTSDKPEKTYDLVGPICESTDVFQKDAMLPEVSRGDLIALLSAGAYGHVMASQYNARPLITEYLSEDFQ